MTALEPRGLEAGELVRVADLLAAGFGFRFPARAQDLLPGTILELSAALGAPARAVVQSLLAGDARCLDALVERVLVGETWFLRYPEQLAAAVRAAHALAGAERLVAWSAGCSTGEEAWSLAMLLLERGRDARSAFVLGSDLSLRALAQARAAVYAERSLRDASPAFVERHLEPVSGGLSPKARVRELVSFRRHNLVHDALAMHGAHLVACRNVLIYFEPDVAVRVLRELYEALVPGGLLLVGAAEQPFAEAAGFEWTGEADKLLFRRPLASRATSRAPASRSGGSARPAGAPQVDPLAAAREAEARGALAAAEALARATATEQLLPEAWLLVANLAGRRGALAVALDATRHALFLAPDLAQAHAAQASLFRRMGQPSDAQRAARNALAAVAALDDATVLRGVEPLSVGALRRVLEAA